MSKYYDYAVTYIGKIIELSKSIKDWHDVDHNIKYIMDLKEVHKRKVSLWSRYGEYIKAKQKKEPDFNYHIYI